MKTDCRADIIEDSISLLREMVRIPSVSFEEREVSDHIFATLQGWGLKPERCGLNIICNAAGEWDPSKKTLVLDAHMDTVPPASSWTRDPFDPGEYCDSGNKGVSGDKEGIIHGLGSNDDGASLVSMIAAFREFARRCGNEGEISGKNTLPINLVLALSVQEEKSGPDGAVLLYGKNGPACVRDADWVIVGEPTKMRAATSERGLLVLDGYAHGVSGHAARSEGVNALYIALDDITALRSHRFSKFSPTMGSVGLNVTVIEAGSAHNVIPDSCHFVVDIRPTEQYSNEEILDQLKAVCRSELRPRNLRNRSSASFPDSPLLKAAESLGIETFSSPTTSNWMRTGKDAIKMGPGDSARSHHADEYVLCSEIEDGIRGYCEFIDTFLKLI